MTTKIILIPINRLKTLEKISTDTPANLLMDSTMYHMEEPQRARVKRTLDHMSEHGSIMKYDKCTGEIQYDRVNASDSDIRELLSTLTSMKRGKQLPMGVISLCAH